ncbi:bifunctional glycosyltransferase family 2/GtrA family protein [Desulfobacula sp.]|uniref:bifunctional glycosyltransferase family 2/GtrA family protein n=1 Tax=Desulfobacula sp. TaxID=2593537 RepID=UPI002626AE85|nr:bifunctional glycosyltransferase family 2/GtrA family protein [Desulfobacula sp.]
MKMSPVVLIPAYKPDKKTLSGIVAQIADFDVAKIIIVDDGSGPDFQSVFDHVTTLPKTHVLSHPTNQGKGAALRTGFRHILESTPSFSSVITVDADGQHLPEDVDHLIRTIKQYPDSLVLGVRDFKGQVPLRSFLGNKATYLMFRGLVGQKISDTQTGLRGIPHAMLEDILLLKSGRYAYELEMLLAFVQKRVPIKEVTITTVYEDNNAVSSFRPMADSFLVYKTLFSWWIAFRFKQVLKYSLSSICSTVADFATYILLINMSCGFVTASILARILSVIIHFSANKYFTFSYKDAPHLLEIGKYLLVVAFNLFSSIFLIYIFITYLSAGEVIAKVMAQLILFFATYVLLNGFVFLKQKKHL